MAETHPPEAAANRSTREDWLALSLETLIQSGIGGVKVLVMARQLKVSRSSFYWFFKSPEDLHQAMLDTWLERNTHPILQSAQAPSATINQAILKVFGCWVNPGLFDPRLDIAVRLWARSDTKVRAVVTRADAQRLEALQQMFARYGYSHADALVRARVLYFTQIGQYTLEIDEDIETRLTRAHTFAQVYSGEPVDPGDYQDFSRLARALAGSAG